MGVAAVLLAVTLNEEKESEEEDSTAVESFVAVELPSQNRRCISTASGPQNSRGCHPKPTAGKVVCTLVSILLIFRHCYDNSSHHMYSGNHRKNVVVTGVRCG
ncbi:hypothetical protein PIB30_101313, partial [Stylosanthes scabra]|nr:hypothetical protein [Stylosanthes scabra]